MRVYVKNSRGVRDIRKSHKEFVTRHEESVTYEGIMSQASLPVCEIVYGRVICDI